MSNEANSWSFLRAQLISLESQTENLLLEFTSLSYPKISDFKESIDDLFNKRDVNICSLSRLLNPDYEGNITKQYHVQRHKEILQKHRKEFEKMIKKKEKNWEHYRIDSAKSNINKHKGFSEDSESNYFLQESTRLDNSHNITDQILLQAYATRDDFQQQKYLLDNMNHKIAKAISKLNINLVSN
ncbi:hypothetical protein PCANB_000541 [Pneumocystis canis]|nr:hypothetical protein PCK1_000456 [Pneumocystis canis]KAG5437827.1 hypothetical protein PCANB_000541 [Pneumocystis canis]